MTTSTKSSLRLLFLTLFLLALSLHSPMNFLAQEGAEGAEGAKASEDEAAEKTEDADDAEKAKHRKLHLEAADYKVFSTIAAATDIEEYMFTLSMGGNQVGGMVARQGKTKDGKIVQALESLIKMKRGMGAQEDLFIVKSMSESVLDSEGNLIFEAELGSEGGVETRSYITETKGSIYLSEKSPDHENFLSFTKPKAYGDDEAMQREAIAEFAKTGKPASRSWKSFSASSHTFEDSKIEVNGKKTIQYKNKDVLVYAFSGISEGMPQSGLATADGIPTELSIMGGFMVAKLTEVPPMDFEVHKVTINSIIHTNADINDFLDLGSLDVSVTVEGKDTLDDEIFSTNLYQSVKPSKSGYRLQLKNNRLAKSFKAPSLPLTEQIKEKGDGVAKYLKPTALCQSEAPEIVAKAKEVVGKETNSLKAAQAITNWVYLHIEKESGARGSATATEVLESSQGDCTEHAALSVAMMRAAGIPARNVYGLVYASWGEEGGIFGYHAWTEAWLGKWVPIDATMRVVGCAAHYAHLGYQEPGEESNGAGMLALVAKSEFRIMGHSLIESE